MEYRVVRFFDQAGARVFHPGETVKDGELTADQIERALTAGNIEIKESPKPEPPKEVTASHAAPDAPVKAKHKVAKHFASTIMPKAKE